MGFEYPEYQLNNNPVFDTRFTYILLISLSSVGSIALQRQCRRYLGLVISSKMFICIGAIICGTIAVNTNLLQSLTLTNRKIPPILARCAYSPIFLLHVLYNVNTKKTEGFMVHILSCSLLLGNGFLAGYCMKFLYADTQIIPFLILGTVLTTTQPEYMIHFLSLNDSYKRIIHYLQGESILALVFTFPLVDYVMHYIVDGTPDWGATLWYFALGHIVGMFIGWFIAKVIAMILKHLVLSLDSIFGIIVGALIFVYVSSIVVSISGFTAGLVFCLIIKTENNIYIDIFAKHFKMLLHIAYVIVDDTIFFFAITQCIIRCFTKNHIDNYFYCYIILSCLRIISIMVVNLCIRKMDKASILQIYLHSVVFPTSTFSLIFATEFYFQSPELGSIAFAHTLFNTGASMLINNFFGINLMKWIKIGYISQMGVDNMTRTLNVIKEFRNEIVREKKMDRSLAQVNWNIVNAYAKLSLGYPYPPLKVPVDWENNIASEYLKETYMCCEVCPNMQKTDYATVYKAALKNQRKIMANLIKSVIRRKFEQCFIDAECDSILRKAVVLYEEGNSNAPVQLFSDLLIIKPMWKHMKRFFDLLDTRKKQIIPRNRLYRWFYYTRASSMYQILNYVITIAVLFPILVQVLIQNLMRNYEPYTYTIALIFFVFDCYVNIIAFSALNLSEGTKTYFSSFWHLMDFISIFGVLAECILSWIEITSGTSSPVLEGFAYIKFARVPRILHFLPLVLPKFMFSMEYGTELRKMLAYQCVLAMNDCINEVLIYCKRWDQEVTDDVLRALTHELQSSKMQLQEIIVQLQTEMPLTTSSVKTKQTLNASRCCMNNYLIKLKFQGNIDSNEFVFLKTLINDKRTYKYSVPPTNPTLLFLGNYWISSTSAAADFLKSRAVLQTWQSDHLLVEVGDKVLGIYMLVKGHLIITHRARSRRNNTDNKKIRFDEFENHFISPGNTFGEIELLTTGRYKYSLRCAEECKTYFINLSTFSEALELSKHPINGLEATLWKRKMMNMCTEVLMRQPSYKYEEMWAIKKKIQRAFVPDLRCYKTFIFVDSIRDIVLIEGHAMNLYTQDIYTAPEYIPRTAKKLVLPRPRLLKSNNQIRYVMTTKFLVIPVDDIEPTAVLAHEEAAASMISHDFVNCPYHVSQTKGKLKVRRQLIDPKKFQLNEAFSASIVGYF